MNEPVTITEAVELRKKRLAIPTDRGFTDDRVAEIAEVQSWLYVQIGMLVKKVENLDEKLERISKGALE